ncbi:M48 family metalloprotease [Halovenus sp. WSH3]|uniref:M48 family metalloprotease n=1 Tax=Halovenus carboxidivorans TaxID=2692199 RepID=A0A6B0T9A0_9EURY|nr:M48 family metalloprotease [Halovenus carboxidivorans]MXR51821.1 M48 family metalloprotease [Halovenus carboxidivorans]
MRRGIATILTLGLLSGFLLAIILGLMIALGTVSLGVAVLAVVLINALVLFVGPWFNDLLYRWLYGLEWISLDELRERSPASAAAIGDVTEEYGYETPKLGYIDDRNPNAFTYGSGRYNARIVLTEGCFEFLDDEETASVVAHELGHITSRDFIIMTVAHTIVQLLYLIAVHAWRYGAAGGSSKSRAASALYVVGALAYLFWFVGEYAVLYLSRVREYAADRFGAEYTHPDALSGALVKIAYGIVMSEDNPELSKATRNIGIMNVRASKNDGMMYHNAQESGDPDLLLRSFLFDLKNPWAKLLELTSTHPLTGKRVRTLSEMEGASRFDFDDILRRFPVDRGRMYRGFARDVAVLSLPTLVAVGYPLGYIAFAIAGGSFSVSLLVGGWLVAVGGAIIFRTRYKFPGGDPEETTVLELLADPYASPVRGRRARLSGELIGRGQAGYRFSPDLMFKDETGLMYLKYESWLPFLGNLLFSVRNVPELIGERVDIEGWYLRGRSPWAGMRRLHAADDTIKSYINYSGLIGGGLLVAVGLGIVVLFYPI